MNFFGIAWQESTRVLPSGKLTELWKITIINGKINCKWSFSIAMSVYQGKLGFTGKKMWDVTKKSRVLTKKSQEFTKKMMIAMDVNGIYW